MRSLVTIARVSHSCVCTGTVFAWTALLLSVHACTAYHSFAWKRIGTGQMWPRGADWQLVWRFPVPPGGVLGWGGESAGYLRLCPASPTQESAFPSAGGHGVPLKLHPFLGPQTVHTWLLSRPPGVTALNSYPMNYITCFKCQITINKRFP